MALYRGLDIATTTITVQLMVPFASILSIWVLNDPIKWRRASGLAIIFAGMVVIISTQDFAANFTAGIMVMVAALCGAINNVQIKNLIIRNSLPVICWTAFMATPVLFLLSFVTESISLEMLVNPPIEAFGALFFVVFAFIFGFGSWFHLINCYKVSNIIPLSLLIPLFGIMSAIFLLNEVPEISTIIGGLLVIIGTGIVVIRRPDFVRKGVGL
jgi:O-acetylserine/cysteine efflux transporter